MQEEILSFSKFPENLRAALLTAGYNQNQLAEAVSLSNVSISRYMTTGRIPRTEELFKIAQALGVSMEYLLTGQKDAESEWKKKAEQAEARLEKIEDALAHIAKANEILTEIKTKR